MAKPKKPAEPKGKKKSTTTTTTTAPKGKGTATAPATSGLEQLLAQYGGGTANPYAGSGSTADELAGVRIVTDYGGSFPGTDRSAYLERQARAKRSEQDASALFRQFLSSSPADIRRMQETLYAAGFYSVDKKSIRFGDRTDAATQKALRDALLQVRDIQQAGVQMTFDDMLKEAARYAPPDDGGDGRAPFSPTVSSPEEIKVALNERVPTILGHGLSDAELDRLTKLYQSLQVSAQRQTYDTAESGGTATAVVPFDVFAQQEAEKLHPVDAHATSLANLSKQVLDGMQQYTQADRTF